MLNVNAMFFGEKVYHFMRLFMLNPSVVFRVESVSKLLAK